MTQVVVCGLAGVSPVAGMGLHYLQYCLGFRDLGLDVTYLEDNMAWPADADYSVAWLRDLFTSFDLPWAYLDPAGRYHGLTEPEVHERCADASLLLNVSGGHWLREHHKAAKVLAFLDTDSAFWQVYAARSWGETPRFLDEHDVHFTFAESIGRSDCHIPPGDIAWKPTRQAVHLPLWADVPPEPGATYTTVMNWDAYGYVEWQGERWGQKDAEFPLIRHLPKATGLDFELAVVNADEHLEGLRAQGWRIVDPLVPTRTIWTFRDYIAASRGEVTVNKQAFVRSRSGWFPERSANYLAAGRGAVVQDTGWTHHIGHGKGLLPFTTADEARDAIQEVERDPEAHGRAARAIAAEFFDARAVLTKLLSDAAVD